MKKLSFILLFISLISFGQSTIETTFNPPEGYERVISSPYHKWVINQKIILDEPVYYHTGYIKPGLNETYIAKFDYKIGTRDLHQCADATIYLHAKYNWDTNQTDRIKYYFTNGMLYSYEDYLKGFRPIVNGNESKLVRRNDEALYENNLTNLRKYLTIIWSYAGTLSLAKYETDFVGWNGPFPGDMFLYGGNPGHVVNVVDIIEKGGRKYPGNERKFILSQSWMPAQEHEILLNPKDNSVWFDRQDIYRYLGFDQHDLKRFKNK